MAYRHWSHPSQNTIAALGIGLMLAGHAVAQPVHIFDDTPTNSRLRSITILELQPSLGATIMAQRPDAAAPHNPTASQLVRAGDMAASSQAGEMSSHPASPQPLPPMMSSLRGTIPSAGGWFMQYVLWLWMLPPFHRIGMAAKSEARPSDNRPLEWDPPPMP